jgi:TadE-like protein
VTRSRQKGQSLVESALTLGVFFALVVGILDVGQMLFLHQTLVERARESVRWGAVHRFDAAAIQNLVLYGTAAPAASDAPFWGLKRSNVSVSNPNCEVASNSDCRVKVVVSGYSYPLLSAAFTGGIIEASMPAELP